MEDNNIEELLRKYMNNDLTPQESERVDRWIVDNIDSPEYDDLFSRLFDKTERPEPTSKDIDRGERTFRSINRFIDQYEKVSRVDTLNRWRSILVVVQLAAMFIIGLFTYQYHNDLRDAHNWSEVYAANGETLRVVLPDESVVWLHNDSRVTYPKRFGSGERKIFAEGEIFADITTDARHPFVVANCGASVKVYGTKFNFKARPNDEKVEVTLLEGSVTLAISTPSGSEMSYQLSPGETIEANRKTGESVRSLINVEEYISWRDKRVFNFVDQPLFEIVAELERNFNVTIVVSDSELLLMRFFATFTNQESLEEILWALGRYNNIEITKQEDIYVMKQFTN
ncbi:MAG: FecR domain-containing protein [Rikenellaceae bacterium]